MSNMGSGFTHKKGEGETTEWEDIMRARGIWAPKTDAQLAREAADELEARAEEARARIDPLEFKSAAELDVLEEEDAAYGDSRVLDSYRARRVAEMRAAAARARFGAVLPLTRPDFVREVNEASADGTWVVLHLHQEHVEGSGLLARALGALAAAKRDVKFMVARADAIMEGYPDKNVPTLLLYCEGVLKGQIVGLGELGGPRVSVKILEWVLHKRGVCKTELEDDPREDLLRPRVLGLGSGGGGGGGGGGRRRAGSSDDEDK
jgi:hypothetical protein